METTQGSSCLCECPLRYLSAGGHHVQKKSRYAKERDPEKRKEFLERRAQLSPSQLVFLDESGFHLAMTSLYGWSEKGERLTEAVPFQKGKNFSVLGAFSLEGMVATLQKEGSVKRDDLEGFLKESLLPKLPTGSVLVLDNARSHHGGRLSELVSEAGCSLLYLPPYSPDFNPIELAWGWIKGRVRRIAPRDGVSRLLAIGSALEALPQEFSATWFRKAGVQC